MIIIKLKDISHDRGSTIVYGDNASRAYCFFVAWYSESNGELYLDCRDPRLLPADRKRIGFKRGKK